MDYVITDKQLKELEELIDDLCCQNCCGELDFDSEKATLKAMSYGSAFLELQLKKVN